MEFSSTEDESNALFEVVKGAEPGKTQPSYPLLAICTLAYHLRQTKIELAGMKFQRKKHASAYNVYIREKEKLGGVVAGHLPIFVALVVQGVLARIVYSIQTRPPFRVDTCLEIVMGENVISEGERGRNGIVVSVDSYGEIVNHSLFITEQIASVLNSLFIAGFSSEDTESPFQKHDLKFATTLPATKKEGLLHPLYRIDSQNRRELVYPKGIGWVGHIKDRSTKPTQKSKAQKSRELRIYPISHIHRLLSLPEIYRKNLRVPPDTLPFRILPPTRKHPNGISLYAPWQIEPNTNTNPTKHLLTLADIPKDSVYLIETDYITYQGINIGHTPFIGYEYSYQSQQALPIHRGLLLTQQEFTTHHNTIIRQVLRNIIHHEVTTNQALLINMQILTQDALHYLDVLDSL
ncbi:hypothetical protein NEHOM01_0777 [Nematocida homosporus]|uniref:uncharacterized protein n=1 Tax=Nematocida homosporus TaxID=1912981 RepID=UPI00221EC36B|nr:uncharacterized protein NEHOM01_0777 [Nematocida homosporus]KAI5185362.1 hypothetical protein NEHOM01_0777 [Nematocida homosporus]